MRSCVFAVVPLLAIASAKEGTTLVPEISGSVTITSTYTYSNPATSLLTETNSNGVVTGLPGQGRTGLVTSQPPVATIPAGLPKGETTITYNASSTIESFVASVGASTTVVLGGGNVGPSGSVNAGSSAGGSKPSGASNGNAASSSSTSSDNAAPTNMKAAVGAVALGAVAAALL